MKKKIMAGLLKNGYFRRRMEKLLKHSVLLMSVLFLLAEALINPFGEFPLNDDWAYARSIFHYLGNSELKFADWQAIPGVPQFISGLAVCKVFGFSFTLLRAISIVSMLISIAVLNKCLKEFSIGAGARTVALALFVFNPLGVNLANTFLPDVPQLLLSLCAFYYMARIFSTGSGIHYALFIVFSVLATLNRQSGLVIPLSFIFIHWLVKRDYRKLFTASLPFVISWLALVCFEWIAGYYNKLPANYNLQIKKMGDLVLNPSFDLITTTGYYFVTSSICLGLFVLPLVAGNSRAHFLQLKESLWARLLLAIYLGLIIVKLVYSGNIFPFAGNIFHQSGIGPVIMTCFNTDEPQSLSVPAKVCWGLMNFAGGLGFFSATLSVILKLRRTREKMEKVVCSFFPLMLVLYLLPVCVNYANDRYLLYLLPFMLAGYATSCQIRFRSFAFFILFLPLLFIGISGTRDYLSINRARWQAVDQLTNKLKVEPRYIDGGFEVNGWYLASPNNYDPTHRGRWWWIDQDLYIISPVRVNGYEVVGEYPFDTWLPHRFKKLYALKRTPS